MRTLPSAARDRVRANLPLAIAAYCTFVSGIGLLSIEALERIPALSQRLAPTMDWALEAEVWDAAPPTVVTRSAVLSDESWNESLRSQRYWTERSSSKPASAWGDKSSSRSNLGSQQGAAGASATPASLSSSSRWGGWSDGSEGVGAAWYHGDGEHFATWCVRLCDGSMTPVSFSTTSDRFGLDERACRSSCDAPTRLYVHKTPNGSVETMVDLKGQPYAKLNTAFLFRTSYDQACKCRPHAWEQASIDRHRMYSLAEDARKGDKVAAANLKSLRKELAKPPSERVAVAASAPLPTREDLKPIIFGPQQIRVAMAAEPTTGSLPLLPSSGPATGGFRAAQSDEPMASGPVQRAPVIVSTTPAVKKTAALTTQKVAKADKEISAGDEDEASEQAEPPRAPSVQQSRRSAKQRPKRQAVAVASVTTSGGTGVFAAATKLSRQRNWRVSVFESRN